ncbi:helix-turn-helix domain-containing protein [Lysinibacillus sp. CD3-6]|uniref:helix-turn-helix domain-containing protein n=1 Tax=Lysinibacillus sp. CD3-6 TaxID=2892541 RepID=UPI0011746356|nr:helix-turn-helix domain-containing protein [Lysinibacillus sp. CD3-6]UED79617.1 helix-turn-helix domain-containing protein [Lysinibacillus sp. CD3-6]
MNKATLSVKETSTLLGVSIGTIYSMVRAREIPHIKIRGRVLFHQLTIEEWLLKSSINSICLKKEQGIK